MSQAAIPFSFESYLQAKLTAGEVVNMNRIVLANIPDLDHTIPIDRNETLPDESQIVYEQDVDQVGKVNSNAVVYSIVMDTSVGDFDFNAMYLIDKDQRTAIGMIVHKESETKTATDETSGVQGNSLVKSMLMQFDGAAAATNITVDAATWQIDYSARLKGMDEDVRIQALDIFGHDAFIANGFKTTQSAGNQYFVESGAAYIGGLKAVLDGDVTVTVNDLPSFIYAVVNRQGTALSAFANVVDLQVSQGELSDYEANGVNYYVAKIATVNADGTVTDERTTSLNEQQFASLQQQIDDVNADLQGHKGAADPHEQYQKKSDANKSLYSTSTDLQVTAKIGETSFVSTDRALFRYLELDDGYMISGELRLNFDEFNLPTDELFQCTFYIPDEVKEYFNVNTLFSSCAGVVSFLPGKVGLDFPATSSQCSTGPTANSIYVTVPEILGQTLNAMPTDSANKVTIYFVATGTGKVKNDD